MHFTGKIYFNFDNYDVWRIYTLLLKASQDNAVTVDVEWRAFTATDLDSGSKGLRGLAASEAVRATYPIQYDRFIRALLTLAYQERDEPDTDKTLAVAAKVAGLDAADVVSRIDEPGLVLLAGSIEAARERGVADVPTIERQGPPVHVRTTGAANYGNAVGRLRLIDEMIRDDGIWVMSKPD